MTEEQADYKTVSEQDMKDTDKMLGKGYRPVIQFEPPSEQIVETEDGYEIAQSLGWVKISAFFRENMLAKLKGAKLSVFICICLHVNEKGEAFPSIDTIARETGLHRDTVMDTVSELEEIPGLLSVIRRIGKKSIYRPAFAARGKKNEPFIPVGKTSTGRKNGKTSRQPVDKTSTTPVDVSPTLSREDEEDEEDNFSSDARKKRLLENASFEWMLLGDGDSELIEGRLKQEQQEEQALVEFESAFGFGTLPWYSNSTWDKFAKFIIKYAQVDSGWPADYVKWRKGDGKYKAYSNRKIRQSPQEFMDTGYPEYDACKMYRDEFSDNSSDRASRLERLQR